MVPKSKKYIWEKDTVTFIECILKQKCFNSTQYDLVLYDAILCALTYFDFLMIFKRISRNFYILSYVTTFIQSYCVLDIHDMNHFGNFNDHKPICHRNENWICAVIELGKMNHFKSCMYA